MPMTADDCLLLHRLTRPEHPSPPGLDDATLTELLLEAQAGDHTAGEQLLGALAMRLAGMARRSHQTTLAHFVSAAWVVIGSFNTTRTHKVLTNLALDTLKQVTRERVARWHERLVHHPELEALPGRSARPEADEAEAVLTAARHLRLLDENTTGVMRTFYLEGYSGRETAERLDSTHDMVRYRCSRGVRTLREHRAELLGYTAG